MSALRRRRGKAPATLLLVDTAVSILAAVQPATVRAVCYQLFIKGLIASMAKSKTNAVSRHLVWARETGVLRWSWIVDETREAERVATWRNPQQLIKAAVSQYRKDYWREQPHWVEVWSEKGTIRGILAPVLDHYGVTFRVMHGYGSATALYDIAAETNGSAKPLTILYVGDWDPSGMQMSGVDLVRRLERYAGAVTIERLALRADDVGPQSTLPSFAAETKTKDPRYKWFVEHYGTRCWELDALSPAVLRQRVENRLLALLDMGAWQRALDVEAVERQSMTDFVAQWPGISMPATNYAGTERHG